MRASPRALAACLALLASPAARAASEGALSGTVSVQIGPLTLADVTPAVVYLEAVDAPAPPPLDTPVELRQHAARFQPSFLAVAVGQPIAMPNDDTIYHNVFSYSRPNDFDLGLYRAGEAKLLHFDQPGPVRLYCSIHERMNGLIFVAPSRLFALPERNGAYRIDGVPPGHYRLKLWSERLPAVMHEIEIRAGESAHADFRVGG